MKKIKDFDDVTNLPGVLEVFNVFEKARINNNKDYIIAIVGIDNFDTFVKFGKEVEENILKKVSDILKSRFDKLGFIGHFENDEFYLLFNTNDLNLILNKFKGINNILKEEPINFKKKKIVLKISVGLAVHEANSDFTNNLVLAQKSLRNIKNSKNNIFYYQINKIVY